MATPEQLAEMQDIATIFATEPGLRVLARWVERFVYDTGYVAGDVNQTLYNLGRKELILAIARNVQLARSPSLYELRVEGGPSDSEPEDAAA